LYNYLQGQVDGFRQYFIGNPADNVNSVLFGGVIGSLFSFLQFLSSSFTGAVSDVYGRKNILLITLVNWSLVCDNLFLEKSDSFAFRQVGTLISYGIWSVSTVFVIFLASRIIGGISKSNVTLCISIMTDITDLSSRSFGMVSYNLCISVK
jgi:MFS family permease